MLLSDFKQELAFHSVKPFILIIMQVFGRTPFYVKRIFDNENIVAVFRRYFERNCANTKTSMLSELVFVYGHMQHR